MKNKQIIYALEFSARAHQNQLRKNIDRDVPYISHPAAVGCLLLEYGFRQEVILAGILHDTIEDTTVMFEDIKTEFGSVVAELVQGVSEDKSLEFVERKQRYFEQVRKAPNEVKAICAADQIANMYSVIIMHERKENLDSTLFKHGVKGARWVAENRLIATNYGYQHQILEKLKEVTIKYGEILDLHDRKEEVQV